MIPIPIMVSMSMPVSVLVKASVFSMLGTFDVKSTAVPAIGLTDARPIV